MPERSASTVAIWAVAGVLAVLAASRLLGDGGEPAPAPVRIDGGGPGAAAPAKSAPRTLYVHVAGAVRRPGLIRVREGTRTATALARAGGPLPRADLTVVNLAAPLQDGQQIVVPVRGAAAASAGPAAGAPGEAGAPGAPIHLSTATVEQLDEVDGIGPTLAERIVEYRDEHGGFRSVNELAEVDGIGEKRLETLREAVQP